MPSQNPTTAGTKDHFPISDACSIAGSSKLQIDAATITPAANPVKARWTRSFMVFFIRNTQAAPSAVPKNGIKIPVQASIRMVSPFNCS